MRLVLRPEAAHELAEALEWYEARCPGLGGEFLRCVDACLTHIERFPESAPVVHRSVRQAVLRRFPFLVMYVVEKNELTVLAIFHAKRDREEWKTRPAPGWEVFE
jgi:hypothetical protein